jgi:hypothetical protein
MFSKTGGRVKEAADILVPFGDRLLIFQVKTKQEAKPASEKSETDFDRIRDKVDDAVGQVKAAISAVRNQRFTKLTTARGPEIPFDPTFPWKMLGLVVIDLLGEEQYAGEDRTAIYNGYTKNPGIPTHIFLRPTFEAMAIELDTFPDLLEFLSVREALLERGILVPTTDDLDLLAIFRMNPDLMARAAAGVCNTLVISAGSWKTYRERYAEDIKRRDQRNESSFLIDGAISWLHRSIGHRIEAGAPEEMNVEQGTVEAYLGAARAFAALTRLERRIVGETLDIVMNRAAAKGDAYSVRRRADTDWAFLCLSTGRSREERFRAICNLSAMAFCYFGLKQLLGIATEPAGVDERSFDFFVLDGEPFAPEEHRRIAQEAKGVFGEAQKGTGHLSAAN